MLVSDDKVISREALKGFFMFLYSEKQRHLQDVSDIEDRMDEVIKRTALSEGEEAALKLAALRYVTF